MLEQSIPRQLQNILASDEVLEKAFYLKELQIYATDRRLLVVGRGNVTDFDYAHISSITYSSKRHWGLLLIGILLVLGGIFSRLIPLIAIGTVLVLLFFS